MTTPIESLLIHRPPMLLVDRLVECVPPRARAATSFADKPYAAEDGFVSAALLIELVAQTVAALIGFNNEPCPGMLVTIDDFDLFGPVRAEWDLETRVEVTRQLGRFCLASGAVYHGDDCVARGDLKLYVEGDVVVVQAR